MAKKAKQRATSVYNFLNQRIDRLDWDGEWQRTFGNPPKNGIWYVGGHSGNGKTSFVVQLMKVLADLGLKIRFYNIEEGKGSPSLQATILREGIKEVGSQIQIVNDFLPYSELKVELETLRINAAIIDSRKELNLKTKDILELKRDFPNLLIIIICHVLPNGVPESAADRQVKQAAKMKITVDRYRAINEGRTFGEIDYYNIWKEKADECWAVVE